MLIIYKVFFLPKFQPAVSVQRWFHLWSADRPLWLVCSSSWMLYSLYGHRNKFQMWTDSAGNDVTKADCSLIEWPSFKTQNLDINDQRNQGTQFLQALAHGLLNLKLCLWIISCLFLLCCFKMPKGMSWTRDQISIFFGHIFRMNCLNH